MQTSKNPLSVKTAPENGVQGAPAAVDQTTQIVDIGVKILRRRFSDARACVICLDRAGAAFKWSRDGDRCDDLVAAAQLARRSPSPVTATTFDATTVALAIPDPQSPLGGLAVSFDGSDPEPAVATSELSIFAYWLAELLERFPGYEPIQPSEFSCLEHLFADAPLRRRVGRVCQSLVDADYGERIALGLVRWRAVAPIAISGGRDIATGSPLGHQLRSAFRDGLSAWRNSGKFSTMVGEHGKSLTIPLCADGAAVGALYVDRPPDGKFSPEKIAALERICNKLGQILPLAIRAERDLFGRLMTKTGFAGDGTAQRKARHSIAAIIVALTAVSFVPTTHRLSSHAYIEGQRQRAIVAPLHGYLENVDVVAGEQVSAGQLLATFATEDLALEKLKWESERARLQKEKRDAAVRQERAKLRMIDAEIAQASAEIALVDSKLSRHEVRAPVDGVIVSGDLTQHLGAPVERGEVLFEIVPQSQYQLALLIDEQDLRNVEVGMGGKLKLNAYPRDAFPFEVSRITPVNEVSVEGNYFLAYSRLIDPPQALQPGMRGIAKTEVGSRPAIVNWSETLRRWLSLKLWAWFG